MMVSPEGRDTPDLGFFAVRHLPCCTASPIARKYCGPSRNSCMIHTQTALECSTSTCAAVSSAPSHSAFVEDDLPIFPHLEQENRLPQ
jgi:hypothetical protein